MITRRQVTWHRRRKPMRPCRTGLRIQAKPRLPNVYVSAILDFGDGNWTVWANGLRVTPDHQSPLFRVSSVRNNAAEIVVPGEDGGRFVLQPYQTWRSRQKDVVEGIVP